MKIAYFTDAFIPNVNGVSFSVDTFSQLLSANNKIEIYAPSYKGRGKTQKRGKVTVCRYYSLPIPTYKDAHLAVPDVVGIYNHVEKFDPDIIHIHTPGSLGLAGILVAKMLRKPLVGTYHTLVSEVLVYASLQKLLDKYLQAIDKVVGGVGADLGLLQKNGSLAKKETLPQKLTWSALNRIYGYMDLVICPSDAIKRELVKRGMKKRVEVVSNGVDLKMFPVKRNYKVTKKILHVGRLGYEKNVDVIIKAFARIAQANSELQLVIAGDGPAKNDLMKMTVNMKISDRVIFLGMVKRELLCKVYKDADVFVTTSTMETQGMVVLEAMACGLPVVGVKRYALPDLVKNGENGYVVKPGDEKMLADRILKIMNDGVLMEKMGNNSRKMALTHEVSDMVRKLSRLYDEVLLKE